MATTKQEKGGPLTRLELLQQQGYTALRKGRKKAQAAGRTLYGKITREGKKHVLTEEESIAYHNILNKPTYRHLEWIVYSYLGFEATNLTLLAIDAAFGTGLRGAMYQWTDFFSMWFGLIMTTFFIHTVHKGKKLGAFQGLQEKMASFFFYLAVADASAGIIAKFNPDLAPMYTAYILPVSAPAMMVFSCLLIYFEPYSRRYRKLKGAQENADHQDAMLKIQTQEQRGAAKRRERWHRNIAVRMHSAKLAIRTFVHSAFNGWAWSQAGKQGENLIRDVVSKNKYHIEPTSGDGQASSADNLVLTAGSSSKKGRGIFGRLKRN